MDECDGARVRPVPDEFKEVFLSDSPSWVRLEPQSVSGDPSPGIEARVHDPAWLLARQWQLGEFRGEDSGSPVSVMASWTSIPVDGWRPGTGAGTAAAATSPAGGGAPMRPLGPGDLLEAAVESEPHRPPGLRARFDAGAQFLADLAEAGFGAASLTAAVLAACRMPDPPADPFDPGASVLMDVFADRVPDGERIAAALAAPTPPPWLPAAAAATAAAWLRWYRGGDEPGCWMPARLEYAFDLSAGPHRLTAPAFPGGRPDWYHLGHVSTAPGGTPSATSTPAKPVWATPLTFPGQPVDRYWEFEDAQVNVGALEAAPHDLARLALAEFALVHSQDWLVVPLDVPRGALTIIDRLSYTTTFGETIVVPRADERGRFQLFEVDALPGLLVPPAGPAVLEGPALEEVGYLRDEAANLAWAVERVVTGPSGQPRRRTDEPPPPAPTPGTEPGAELDYLLATTVPGNWVPLVPTRRADATIELRKGELSGSSAKPLGVLLAPGQPLAIFDEEVPREGVTVRRVPVLARRADGRYARWIARRVTTGRGEGTSGLTFDTATPRRP
ncbi:MULTISPECIES: hypothetical protein [Pseudofrankia]|uniref:hypothetical protein n=1 Tax=Pseudofrankia TaxID=2994363 RepID=UPI000234B4D3|nr:MULTISPECIES: hypothetical protein [Pseudofrankia]OHV30409.1 hypothetical protein BCD49_33705 [Pseudofrankia sp. EUN1h]